MLKPSTLAILKQSIPALEEHGLAITTLFYKILLERHPELTNIFNFANQRSGNQARALADAVFAYASLAETPEQLMPAVNRIANKHASLNIQAKHYPMVGESLLMSLAQTLDIPMEHEIIQGWGDAYESLASIFIAHEAQLYKDSSDKEGGWEEYREFTIDQIHDETPDIKSFYLSPKDNGALASFSAGQYVGVKLDIPNHPTQEIRQYSLSDTPEETEYYRISVKAERGAPQGTVSNYLHQQKKVGDSILLSAPYGDFAFKQNDNPSAVFISGGVGITPLMSIFKSQITQDGAKDLTFIHCTQSEQSHCFKNELNELKNNFDFNNYSVYADDESGDYHGFINQEALNQLLPETDSDYYFCGPFAFMVTLRQLLVERGVNEEQMHYEVFGPTLSLAA